jgi:hypothetical protein
MENTNAHHAHSEWFLHTTKCLVRRHQHVTELTNILVMNSTATSAEHAHKDGSLLRTEDHAIDLNQSVDVPKCSTGRDGIVKLVHQDTLLLKDTEDVFQLHNAGDIMNTMVMLTAAINARPVFQDGLPLLISTHVPNTHLSVHALKCSLKTMELVCHAQME